MFRSAMISLHIRKGGLIMKCKRLFSIFCTTALSVMSLGQSLTTAVPVFPAAVTAYAEETASKVTLNGMTFSIFSDHAEVTECVRSYEGELIIPDEVNGVPVTSIGFSSIAGCEKITSVTIPDTVTSINVYAFQACSSLTAVKIPDSVTFIGDNAFVGTKWLEAKQEEDLFVVVNGILIDGKTCSGDIVIPDSVTMIGDGAFSGCHEITSVVIPDSVTKIGTDAFSNCAYLSSVSIPDSVTEIPAWAFYGTGLTSVVIPDSVTSIDDRAFCVCYQLETITIPESVAYIGFETFDSTQWMSSQQTADPLVIVNGILINGKMYEGELTVPDTVTMIADGAFNECETITSLTIPDSVTRIGSHAFQDCTMLETVVMADSVTDMGEYAFNWCSNLESVTLSASLKSIENDTFTFCDILREIDIPASVSSIGEAAFLGCRMLENITINNPDCNIFDQSDTICTEYDKDLKRDIFDGVIWGCEGSTAQAYALKYGCTFEAISSITGDANGDGEFNVSDVIILQKWLLAVPDTHFADWRAANFYPDDRLDVFDLCLMKRALIYGTQNIAP